jgi:hypothetical protein
MVTYLAILSLDKKRKFLQAREVVATTAGGSLDHLLEWIAYEKRLD